MPPPRENGRRFAGALVLACLALIAVDAALLWRNRGLTARIRQLEHAVRAAETAELAVGHPVPAVTLLDADGGPVRVPSEESAATLLLVTSTGCTHCDDVAAAWEELAQGIADAPIDVRGLVLDATPADLRVAAAPWPLLAPGPDAWALVRRLPGVPAALLVDASGTLVSATFGVEGQPELRDAVEAFVGTH